ncbi:hypothetical protein FD06_GL000462 [Apilactobacillus ozensis DSM 23829 = JCM 17196]|uniref:Helix-turn-helix domain-containing protein n=1 Tax=Apilactobacillus ozensis DSM 23829 = JCM 17196 TaxID=1423781 RepID=A0A0R2AM22_9LACO|nr:hypothetical protein [Apilactobacillus ozensis]KRM67743.1 hypothetical protein FD06_GL000462 [Apilactobacillus ozensis DSM 23829 = JCM 17196]
MEFKLPPAQETAFYNYVQELMHQAILNAEDKVNLNTPWLKGKKQAAKWLGISPQSLAKLMAQGLPVHYLDDMEVVFFNKQEINKYLLAQ